MLSASNLTSALKQQVGYTIRATEQGVGVDVTAIRVISILHDCMLTLSAAALGAPESKQTAH